MQKRKTGRYRRITRLSYYASVLRTIFFCSLCHCSFRSFLNLSSSFLRARRGWEKSTIMPRYTVSWDLFLNNIILKSFALKIWNKDVNYVKNVCSANTDYWLECGIAVLKIVPRTSREMLSQSNKRRFQVHPADLKVTDSSALPVWTYWSEEPWQFEWAAVCIRCRSWMWKRRCHWRACNPWRDEIKEINIWIISYTYLYERHQVKMIF